MRDTRTEEEKKNSKGIVIIDRAGGKGGMPLPKSRRNTSNTRDSVERGRGKKRTPMNGEPKSKGRSPGSRGPGKETKSGRDVKGDFTKTPGMHPAVMDTWTNPKTGETTSLTRGYKPKEGSGWERSSNKSGIKSNTEEGRKKLAELRAKRGSKRPSMRKKPGEKAVERAKRGSGIRKGFPRGGVGGGGGGAPAKGSGVRGRTARRTGVAAKGPAPAQMSRPAPKAPGARKGPGVRAGGGRNPLNRGLKGRGPVKGGIRGRMASPRGLR